MSELQRKQLLSSLGLNQTQLQQLAGLLGNDHIKHIAKDKLQQLREANPGQHVVAALAKQVLQLQPALGGSSSSGGSGGASSANGFVAAFGPVLPEVAALVAAAVKAVGGGSEPEPEAAKLAAGKGAAAAAASAGADANGTAAATTEGSPAADGQAAAATANGTSNNSVHPLVVRLVNRAMARVVTAAEQGLDPEDLTEADLDAFLEGEEFEVSNAAAEDEEADEAAAADGQAATAAAGGAGGSAGGAAQADSSPAAAAASQVERCKRAMQQYSLKGVAAPVVAGSGERWRLQKRHILMQAVGLEDMSKTPAHVLLQPLRLAVYAGLGLNLVTEYLCVPDEQWRSWANGRVVEVPALPPKREKRGSKRGGKGAGGAAAADGQVDPAVKRLVAAAFATVLGSADTAAAPEDAKPADAAAPSAAAEDAADTSDKAAAAEAAAEDAPAAAAAEPAEDSADAATADANDNGIDPIVRKLVSTAMAKAITAANRAAARANKPVPPYEQLPKPLPQKPVDLAALLLRRLRAVDKAEQQFTKLHEKLLQLQVRRSDGAFPCL